MALMLGRCPPGKMCSFMKSGEAQYAAYLESGMVMTYTARPQRSVITISLKFLLCNPRKSDLRIQNFSIYKRHIGDHWQRYTAGCCRPRTDGGNGKTFTVASFNVAFIQQLFCGMEKPELATW